MPGNENTKSGILQGLFICRTSELNPRLFINTYQTNNLTKKVNLNEDSRPVQSLDETDY